MNVFVNEEDQLFCDMTRKRVDRELPEDWCRKLETMEHQIPNELWDKQVEFGA